MEVRGSSMTKPVKEKECHSLHVANKQVQIRNSDMKKKGYLEIYAATVFVLSC